MKTMVFVVLTTELRRIPVVSVWSSVVLSLTDVLVSKHLSAYVDTLMVEPMYRTINVIRSTSISSSLSEPKLTKLRLMLKHCWLRWINQRNKARVLPSLKKRRRTTKKSCLMIKKIIWKVKSQKKRSMICAKNWPKYPVEDLNEWRFLVKIMINYNLIIKTIKI